MRLGLFGGTFDPIHSAHIAVAREAADHFALDQVLLIPNAIPPHKQRRRVTDYRHRLAMAAIAAGEDPRFAASDLEAANEKSYSILTVERLQARSGDRTSLFFLIGADAFDEIATWHRWRELLEKVEFIVISRPGYAYKIPAGARVHRLETLHMDVSSTAIRRKLAAGESPVELPPGILSYIRANRLYSADQM